MASGSLTNPSLYLGNLIPVALADLSANDATPRATPGGIGYFIDAFGIRLFRYIQNVSTGTHLYGSVMSRPTDVTTLNSITSATTTSVTQTGAGMTANAYKGYLLIDETEATAGAAPEGQIGVITSNTTTTVNIDANYPFSVAPSVGAALRIKANSYHANTSAAADTCQYLQGVVVGTSGITTNYYGWVQFDGVCPYACVTGAAITANGPIMSAVHSVAGAGFALDNTSSNTGCIAGWCMKTVAAANSLAAPVRLTLGSLLRWYA